MKNVTNLFSTNLFWDTNETTLDLKQHKRFIIGRVLMRGRLKDWVALNQHYSLQVIKKEALNMRYLDKLTLHFCSVFLMFQKLTLDVIHKHNPFRNFGRIELKFDNIKNSH